jgi:hypothetical protein
MKAYFFQLNVLHRLAHDYNWECCLSLACIVDGEYYRLLASLTIYPSCTSDMKRHLFFHPALFGCFKRRGSRSLPAGHG